MESDADEQLIIRVPFTGSVKLKSISLLTEPGSRRPTQLHLYANTPALDFDTAPSTTPTQTLDLIDQAEAPDAGEPVEYPVKVARFAGVRELQLFVEQNGGADTTRIYYIGFKGEYTPVRG